MTSAEQHDLARLRQAFASLEGDDRRSLDSGRIFDALHGDLSVEERRALVDELLTDSAAAEAWRLAIEMPPDRHANTVSRLGRWNRWVGLAVAATLVLVGAWTVVRSQRDAAEPAYRGLNGPSIATALPPGAAITRAKPTLRWTAVDGGRYRVRVLSADLTVIAQSDELTRTEYTLKRSALDQIPVGAQILWQVTARIPTEGMLESPTFYSRVE